MNVTFFFQWRRLLHLFHLRPPLQHDVSFHFIDGLFLLILFDELANMAFYLFIQENVYYDYESDHYSWGVSYAEYIRRYTLLEDICPIVWLHS